MRMCRVLLLPVLLLVVCGCAGPASFVYSPDGESVEFKETVFPDKTVAVSPFRDFRSELFDTDSFYLYLIPLIPYGYVQYDRPEDAEMLMTVDEFHFEPGIELAQAAAFSLNKSKLFKQAMFVAGAIPCDYIFSGSVLSTYYMAKPFSYGLMSAGPFLWMIGLPAGTVTNRLALYFTLTDAKTGKVVWQYGYSGEKFRTVWLYANQGKGIAMYSELMAEAMNKAIKDLRRRLKKSRQ